MDQETHTLQRSHDLELAHRQAVHEANAPQIREIIDEGIAGLAAQP
ncbi:hypothetical protein X743_17865 [Mesorhizobium sp. LNHC252B00]|nr:hypothetical protein X743_17865 [Mesorhizobium sp. LNHC252B00]